MQKKIWKQVFVTQTKGFTDVSLKTGFWQTFANQCGGTFNLKQTVSKDLTALRITVPTKNGLLEFSESDTHPFKILMTSVTDQPIKFILTQKDLFDRWMHLLGFRGIDIPHPDFSKKYIIRGQNEKRIQQIFYDDQIIPLILKTNIFMISCDDNKRGATQQIRGTAGRTVNTVYDLAEIFTLFSAIARQLNVK